MIIHNEIIKQQLDKKIDDTLDRYQIGFATISDGYNILRWAEKGLLARKFKDDI